MATIKVWAPIALAILYVLYGHYKRSKYLANLPWLGTQGKILFPRLRARLVNSFGFKKTLEHGYEQYASQGKTCVLPTISDDFVLLPTNEIDWIIGQPDSLLSVEEPHIKTLQSDYTFSNPVIVRNPTHHHIVKSDLTRQLNYLTEDIVDELAKSIDDYWGTDEKNFHDVHVFGTIIQIVARTSNRIFVGLPLCRNEDFLANAAGFAREVPMMSQLLRQFPEFMRPALAPILMRKNKRHIAAVTEQIRPEIIRRQDIHNTTSSEKKTADLPNDLLTWLIQYATTLPDPIEREPETIAGRLLAIQFAAIHTSSFSITNCIFDLLAAPDGPSYIAQLREEATSILAANNNIWTKTGLSKMHKIDSTLRESTRLGSFLGPGLIRMVTAREGLTSPNGTFLPYGSMVGTLTHGVHNDESIYTDAATFDPFRFADQRLESQPIPTLSSADENHDEKIPSSYNASGDFIRKANLAFVSTSATYHPFGHGRHACPGRFFAANELKLLLAYIVMNYDFEFLDQRPESPWLGTVLVPPMKANIRVRRRK